MTDPVETSATVSAQGTADSVSPPVIDPVPLSVVDPATEKAAVLADWSARLSAELALNITVDIDEILSLAGAAAHTVIRPAAPLTTFLVGYAAGLAASELGSAGSGADTAAKASAEAVIEHAMESARALLRAAASTTARE